MWHIYEHNWLHAVSHQGTALKLPLSVALLPNTEARNQTVSKKKNGNFETSRTLLYT
jgi:hypothetical protein